LVERPDTTVERTDAELWVFQAIQTVTDRSGAVVYQGPATSR
jgi:hypothetical protein